MRAQEGRKRAIDVESASERKRAKMALETCVVKARSLCDAAITAAYEKLIQPSLHEYVHDKIDSAELDRRKKAAWEKAASEHPPLRSLDAGVRCLLLLPPATATLTPQTRSALWRASAAYRAYTAKVAARVAAEKALAAAETAEEEAEAAVEVAVRAIEGQGAGPSGVVKHE